MSFGTLYQLTANDKARPLKAVNRSEPEIVGIVEMDRHFKKPQHLPYFRYPRRYPLNLGEGFESYKFRNKDYYHANLAGIEYHLLENRNTPTESEDRRMCKIHTSRSALLQILVNPFFANTCNTSKSYVLATKFNDVIYLACGPDHKAYYGKERVNTYSFKLRQLVFSDSPLNEPKTDIPVDENKQIYCMYRRKLGHFDLLYSAEIQGVESEYDIKDINDVKKLNDLQFILTKLAPGNPKRNWRTSPRLKNWYFQAELSKSNVFYVAKRDAEGLVHEHLQKVHLGDLCLAQFGWQPNVHFEFLHKFLQALEDLLAGVDCSNTVYKIQYESETQSFSYRVRTGEFFLSTKFITAMQEQS